MTPRVLIGHAEGGKRGVGEERGRAWLRNKGVLTGPVLTSTIRVLIGHSLRRHGNAHYTTHSSTSSHGAKLDCTINLHFVICICIHSKIDLCGV